MNDSGFDMLRGFDGTPRAASWAPVTVHVTNPELLVGDFPAFRSTAPIFSLRAVEALFDLLEPNGELLPLLSDDGQFFTFNVTALSDVLDEQRSKVFRIGSGRIIDIQEYAFHQPVPEQPAIFKFRQMTSQSVYVTDRFLERVAQHKLAGFEFRPIQGVK